MNFLKERWPLFLVAIIFITLKIPHLYYPFYWDESWPYASAVNQMYLHGPSLLPTALDGEITRGHPLFFHAAAVTWMKIFGASHFSMHSFALFVSVCVLVAIYEAALRLYNIRVAVAAMVLTAFQVIFFVQAAFILPEILLGLLAFLSIYFYVRQRYLLTVLFLTMLFYTKESGLVVGAVLGIDALITFFNARRSWRERVFKIISVGIPVLLIGVFFLLQKYYRGWYFLPLYEDLIEHSWNVIYYKFYLIATYLFIDDYRMYVYYLLSALAIAAAIKQKNLKFLALLAPVILVVLINTGSVRDNVPSVIIFMLIVLSIIWSAYVLTKFNTDKKTEQSRMIILCVYTVVGFWIFSCLNFLLIRYLFVAMFPLFLITAYYFDLFIRRLSPYLFYVSIAVILGIEAYTFRTDTGHGDTTLGAFDGMEVHQAITNFLEENKFYNSNIGAGGYLERIHLTDVHSGFLHSKNKFSSVAWDINGQTDIVIFDNIEEDYRYDETKKDTSFRRIYRIEKGDVWGEVYQRKKN